MHWKCNANAMEMQWKFIGNAFETFSNRIEMTLTCIWTYFWKCLEMPNLIKNNGEFQYVNWWNLNTDDANQTNVTCQHSKILPTECHLILVRFQKCEFGKKKKWNFVHNIFECWHATFAWCASSVFDFHQLVLELSISNAIWRCFKGMSNAFPLHFNSISTTFPKYCWSF